jgi:hypothetical protein
MISTINFNLSAPNCQGNKVDRIRRVCSGPVKALIRIHNFDYSLRAYRPDDNRPEMPEHAPRPVLSLVPDLPGPPSNVPSGFPNRDNLVRVEEVVGWLGLGDGEK